jgi:hypothetical protein
MKKIFYMDDVRNIFGQLQAEEISMSKALELLNEKADKAEERAFSAGWRLRMSRKGSAMKSTWTQWKEGSDEVVG